MSRLSALAFLLTLALAPLAAPAGAADWTLEQKVERGASKLRLWSRPVPGSDYPEFRMELRLRAAPDEVASALVSNLFDPRTWPAHYDRNVLQREPDRVLSHDTIAVPLFADRDAVVRTEIRRDPSGDALHIEWRSESEAGPPPSPGVVRMPRSEGSWSVESDGRGGSRAVCRSFIDFAGRIPGAMVSSGLEGSMLDQAGWLRRTIRERHLAGRR